MLGLLLAAALSASAGAPAVSSCELHVFALGVGEGPQPKGNMFFKVEPPSDDPLAFINVMSPKRRMMQVGDAEYRRALNLADATPVVRHWDVTVDRGLRKQVVPLIATPSRCHFELAGYSGMGIMASRSRSGRNEFVVNLSLREFDANGGMVFEIDKDAGGVVDTEKKVGRAVALQSMQDASLAMIDEFGQKVAKQRDKDLRKTNEGSR